jgi:alpha-1,3-rhamnosyltransferase
VSIVVPYYNRAQFLNENIQSVIDLDYKNIELTVIDDGSKNNRVEVIRKLIPECKARFKRFEFRHRPNKGLSATLNQGIIYSKGQV